MRDLKQATSSFVGILVFSSSLNSCSVVRDNFSYLFLVLNLNLQPQILINVYKKEDTSKNVYLSESEKYLQI